jgi:Transposase DDE domain
MKMSDGSFHECYKGQAVVDAEQQVILANDLTQCASDAQPTADAGNDDCQLWEIAGSTPGRLRLLLGGEPEDLANRQIDALIATGRWPHGEPSPPAPRGRIPAHATARERMARRTWTKAGRAAYARRKTIVEPVFGQMTILQGARHLLLRGKQAAAAEWSLLCTCHNLRKLFAARGADGLAGLAPA